MTVHEASRKGARLNKRHAIGWEEIVNGTNALITAESTKIISDITHITDAMMARNKEAKYTTGPGAAEGDAVTPLSIETAEEPSANMLFQTRRQDNVKRKKIVATKRHTPKRARVESSEESEGAKEAANKAIDELIEAADEYSESHCGLFGAEKLPLDEETLANLAVSATCGATGVGILRSIEQETIHDAVEEIREEDMEENNWSIVPSRNKDDPGVVRGSVHPPTLHGKFKVALSGFRKIDLMHAFTEASSSEELSVASANTTQLSTRTIGGGVEGMQLMRTRGTINNASGKNKTTSPVSLHRQMCAVELDIREEIEEGPINLNVTMSQGPYSTQPHPKRVVKPGKYARSPFVMGYDPPSRAPTDVVKIYKLFYRENPIKLPE
ncbi:uncharacterized protein LOC123425702 [Hordeum vulgare subsp. vulgare]|uniref:uncharacterized protein LOC123425702 n=1 Tax=Hordeum vulgare subsp. vulgare TaxID=112509 RepID=UPI001D1A4EA6|nr:uncharacterized protein LOC123425702 [Hordeum vulgare subsp. vulgare]